MRLAKFVPPIVVGMFLTVAGVAKLYEPLRSATYLHENFLISMPFATTLIVIIGIFEIVLGLWLVTLLWPRASRMIAACSLMTFLVFSFLSHETVGALPPDTGCGCFGESGPLASLEEHKATLIVVGLIGLIWSLDVRLGLSRLRVRELASTGV